MSIDSLVQLTLRSYVDGPSETLLLPARPAEPDGWADLGDVMVCDRPTAHELEPGVLTLQVHDLLAETGHLHVAAALGEMGRYRVLAHRLMVAVVSSLLVRSGWLLADPETAHDAMRHALDRLIDHAVAELA